MPAMIGGPCCGGEPPPCEYPARVGFLIRVKIADCPHPEGVPAANVVVTLWKPGDPGNAVTSTTPADGIAWFEAEDFEAAGLTFGDFLADGRVAHDLGECRLDEPVPVRLGCLPNTTVDLGTISCARGYAVTAALRACDCPGDTFTVRLTSSDGNEGIQVFARGPIGWEASPARYCWPVPPGGFPVSVTAEVVATSRPAVHAIAGRSGSTTSFGAVPLFTATIDLGSIPLTPPHECCEVGPVPRTLYLSDEFGDIELIYRPSILCDNPSQGVTGFSCGWVGRSSRPADPDAGVYVTCADGSDGYKVVTAGVPVYYKLIPSRCDHGVPGTEWTLHRGPAATAPGEIFWCPEVPSSARGFRPCAPSPVPGECPPSPGFEPRVCCDFDVMTDDLVAYFFFARGGADGACGDDPWLMEFALGGLTDNASTNPILRRIGLAKYNGSAIVHS